MKKSNLLLGALLGLGITSTIAQELSVDALIRPRFEYRHGFQNVASDDVDGSAFISQRTSLKFKFTDEKIKAFVDLQDVSVWGDRGQLTNSSENFRVQQAWADVKLAENWSTKVGRQEINYDDQRIIGSVGWTQQSRTHDALIFKYKKGSLKADLGFSFNQNAETNSSTEFIEEGNAGVNIQYKSLQYLHLNNKFSDSFSGSFLFLNNSFQDGDAPTTEVSGLTNDISAGTNSRQLTGVHANYKKGNLGITGSFYTQFGEIWNPASGETLDVEGAFDAKVDITYKPGKTLFGLGYEYITGDEDGAADGEQNAFFPLYGTNHKFNGFMDLFYVFNNFSAGGSNFGLQDLNLKTVIKTGAKSSLLIKGHMFSTAEDTGGSIDGYLGSEIDLVYSQKITPYAVLKVGYSQAFLESDFADERAASGDAADIQNWGWVMLTVKPNLFKWKKEATEAK